MGPISGLVVYLIIWWLVFFMVLPFGIVTPEEAGEEPTPGAPASAPVRPRVALKAGITTLIAAVLWGVYYYVAESGLVSLR